MNNIDRDELRKYVVERAAMEKCREVVRILEDLGEPVYHRTSWKTGEPWAYLYYNGYEWTGTEAVPLAISTIDINYFLELLKNSDLPVVETQGKTAAEVMLEYFKQSFDKAKQCKTTH